MREGVERTAAQAATLAADGHWHRYSAGPGAKGQVGLDHYQVRTWTGWHRHITPAVLALVFLAVLAAHRPGDDPQRVPLTLPEIRRLLAVLLLARPRGIEEVLHRSRWRRCHQAIAQGGDAAVAFEAGDAVVEGVEWTALNAAIWSARGAYAKGR